MRLGPPFAVLFVVLLAGCDDDVVPARARLHAYAVAEGESDAAHAPAFPHVGAPPRLEGEPILEPAHFEGWRRIEEEDPRADDPIRMGPLVPEVRILGVLTEEGARRFAEATGRLVGRSIAFTIDGRVSIVVHVAERVSGGLVVLFRGPPEGAAPVEAALRGR